MRILYVSTVCSTKKLTALLKESIAKPALNIQKYHRMFIEGLSNNQNVKVEAISTLPISRSINKRLFWKKDSEMDCDRLKYTYLGFINLPIIRQVTIGLNLFRCLKHSMKAYTMEEKSVLCDSLNLTSAIICIIICRIYNVKSIGIVTDIPMMMYKMANPKGMINKIKSYLFCSITQLVMKKFDAYVLLTEDMNHIINKKNKPNIVIEGFADTRYMQMTKDKNKETNNAIMFSGGINTVNGVDNLVNAFMQIQEPYIELWLCGSGKLENWVKKQSEIDKRIKYFGVVPNEVVVELQSKAKLVVNTRPCRGEFIKYSFPSKNIEYMASGTPLVTTKLPCIPVEYEQFVYYFEDDKIEDIKDKLIELINVDDNILKQKGEEAKVFVQNNKNNIEQTRKIINKLLIT